MFKLNFLLTNEQLGRIQICLMKLKNGQYTYQSGMRIELSFLIAAQWRSSYHRYRRTDGWAFPLRRVNLLSAGTPCCCSWCREDSERTLRGLGGLRGLCGLWEDSVDSGRTGRSPSRLKPQGADTAAHLRTTWLLGNNRGKEEKTCTAAPHLQGVHLVKMGNSSEKCYSPQDRTLTFVDGEDELDCK